MYRFLPALLSRISSEGAFRLLHLVLNPSQDIGYNTSRADMLDVLCSERIGRALRRFQKLQSFHIDLYEHPKVAESRGVQWKEQFLRVDQERSRLSARLEELASGQIPVRTPSVTHDCLH